MRMNGLMTSGMVVGKTLGILFDDIYRDSAQESSKVRKMVGAAINFSQSDQFTIAFETPYSHLHPPYATKTLNRFKQNQRQVQLNLRSTVLSESPFPSPASSLLSFSVSQACTRR